MLKELIDTILKKDFDISYLEFGKKLEYEISEEITDKKKELKNIFTDFVIKEFYVTSHQSDSMIKLIFETHHEALSHYIKKKGLKEKDIIFIYKGGNVLRTVAYETMRELPGSIADKIKAYYQNYFKKSDNDFSFVINPHLTNFQEVYNDIKNLAFVVQNYLRNVYIANNTKYFDYYRLSDVERNKILKKYIDELNSSATVTQKLHGFDGKFVGLVFGNNKYFTDDDLKQKTFDPQKDMNINFVNEQQRDKKIKKVFSAKLINPVELDIGNYISSSDYDPNKFRDGAEFYISANDSLTFGQKEKKASFALIRTKISVNAYLKESDGNIKLNGELIDVTVVNKLDANIAYLYDNMSKYVTTYTFPYGDENVNFKSYSIEYLTKDLEHILFLFSEFPWDDTKYQKRIKRLMYMYFVLLLINSKYDLLMKKKYINFMYTAVKKLKKDKNLSLIRSFLEKTTDDTKKHPYRELFENLNEKMTHPDLSGKDLAQYLDLIEENLILQLEILNDISEYKNSEIVFTQRMIENVGQMAGNYKNINR